MRHRRTFGSGIQRASDVRSIGRERNAGHSLAVRRRWYADGDDVADDDGGTVPDDAETDAGGDDPTTEDDVPELLAQLRDGKLEADEVYAMISGLRSESAAGRQARRELQALKEAQEAERRKAQEEQGEYKALWEAAQKDLDELKALREAREARMEQLQARNEARITELAKDRQATVRDIIETAGADDPDKIAVLLDKIIPTIATPTPAPDLDGGAKGDNRKTTSSTRVKLNKVSL
ncbi:MAG: OmpH family outer membrane protein [Anaerolineae bacterium]